MKTLKNIESTLNITKTENYDIAYKSTFDKNLDLFALMGGMRYNPKDLMRLFILAYNEDEELAIRNLFYLRDVRGGMGERRNFKMIIRWLGKNYPRKLNKIIKHIPEYGRWDDILELLENESTKDKTVQLIKDQLEKDKISEIPSLLGKWLPSINTSSTNSRKFALILSKSLGLTNKEYRKLLSHLRNKIGIIETKLTQKEYDFDYSKVPSQAMKKYVNAFYRNDEERYLDYFKKLSEGKANLNVATLYPHQIISKYYRSTYYYSNENMPKEYEIRLMEEQWKALKRSDTNVNTIVVRDGSGSMMGTPIEVATALAILFSEQLKGEFKDKFITFSANPELISLRHCKSIQEKINETIQYGDCTNTNIEKVYNLILEATKDVPIDEQIDKILIIS